MLYDVDIEASACVLSSRYAMLCYDDDDDDDDDDATVK